MIYMFLANGFEEVEALCPLDVLRRAGLDVRTVSVTTDRAVTGSHNITVQADMTADTFMAMNDRAPDMIILPGGMPGTTNLDQSEAVEKALKDAIAADAYIAAICAAPMVLGKRGLLDGKRATCYPGFESFLFGATEVGGKVICDGKIITAIGMGVALEFGLALVNALMDASVADRIREAVHA